MEYLPPVDRAREDALEGMNDAPCPVCLYDECRCELEWLNSDALQPRLADGSMA